MNVPAWSPRTKILLGCGVVIALAGGGYGIYRARHDRPVEVREETVTRRDLVAAVTASGKIQPQKKVDVSADITGRITKLAVREGDVVERGQFLLQIDPTVYEANLARARAALSSAEAVVVQARANRDQAQRTLRRADQLHDQSPTLISPEQMEQANTAFEVAAANLTAAEHQVDQARASVQEANDNLRKTRLVAPMAGRITRLPVEEGEVAVPSTFSKDVGLLLTISDLSVVQAKVRVDETDVVRLHLGDSVDVSIDAFPDTSFTGLVTKISNSSIDNAGVVSGTENTRAVDYEVEVTLHHPPPDVRPDLSATARIVTGTRQRALAIPIVSLTVRENTPLSTENRPVDTSAFARRRRETEGVFVIQNRMATFRPVKVGVAGDEYFEVLDGLREGEVIAAGPYQTIRDLKDGARVKRMKPSADSAKARKRA
ncbi:MAG TPA: efflux RND transporter periplasmic adaptor subunit [Gemmatimonadales bacterium]|nr:efflux RND transporter periplasmic adaptor subunit [Gemmatimonadales bacterium]